MTSEGWHSKVGWAGKAHYITAEGRPACASISGPRGIKMGELFMCDWKLLDANDHLCGFCTRLHPRQCLCGKCRVAPRQSAEGKK